MKKTFALIKNIFKYTALAFLLLVTLIVGLFAFDWITGCGDCLNENDYAFMEKVDAQLQDVGDTVKVADIHPGDWKEVCTFGWGVDASIINKFSTPPEKGTIINGAHPFITDRYDESAIIFKHSDTELEVYRMIPEHLVYAAFKSDSCFKKEEAYFYLDRNATKTVKVVSEEDIKDGQ